MGTAKDPEIKLLREELSAALRVMEAMTRRIEALEQWRYFEAGGGDGQRRNHVGGGAGQCPR